MRDDLVGRRRAILAEVFSGVRVGDQRHVVPAGEATVHCRANTRVGLGTRDHDSPNATLGEQIFEIRVLERVAVQLGNERFRLDSLQLCDELPWLAVDWQLFTGVLYPRF